MGIEDFVDMIVSVGEPLLELMEKYWLYVVAGIIVIFIYVMLQILNIKIGYFGL